MRALRVKIKTDKRISHLANNLYTNKHKDCLSFSDVKNALHNIHKQFTIFAIYETTGITSLVFKRFYASVAAKELKLGLNDIHLQIFTARSMNYLEMVALIKI